MNEVKVVPNVTVIYQDQPKTTTPGCLEIFAMLITLVIIVIALGVMN